MGHKQAAGVGAGIEKLHVPQIKSVYPAGFHQFQPRLVVGVQKQAASDSRSQESLLKPHADSAHKYEAMVRFLQPITTIPPSG